MRSTGVVAAIPTFNNAERITTLLPQVLEQDYSAVFVLDDASRDGTPDIVRSQFGTDVKVLSGKENIGAAGNRNRILEQRLGDAALHFIDGDQELISERTPELILSSTSHPSVGAVGGLITDGNGNMWPGNFVPPISLAYYAGGAIQASVMRLLIKNGHRGLARAMRIGLYPLLRNYSDLTQDPRPRKVFTAIEGNMAINASLFERVGGYDPKLRYHEAQDLAFKLQQADYVNMFDPAIETQHSGKFSMRGKELEIAKATIYLMRKYGRLRFLFSV